MGGAGHLAQGLRELQARRRALFPALGERAGEQLVDRALARRR